MMNIKIKEGIYSDERSVVVIITEEIVSTNTTTIEISEDTVLRTIEALELKKQEFASQVDAEILTNEVLLGKIRSFDRSKSIAL